jgi:23S rRNA (cytosine1962-C5)-methyltransferase
VTVPTVRIKGKLTSPHPWVWRTRLERDSLPRRFDGGGVVKILDGDGQPVGRGLLHPHVTIGLRILTRDIDEEIDQAFFAKRFAAARALRAGLGLDEVGNGYRLCHSESDDLSGLMVDVLGDVVRVDCFAKGMASLQVPIRAALAELLPGKAIVMRGNKRSGEVEGFAVDPKKSDPAETEVREHGLRYKVDLREGHKTGFFLDQRENRAFLAGLAAGKTVLDMHCYSGGFALNAARGGAAQVTGVDLDEKAVAMAKRNAKLNQAKAKFVQADAFHYLRDLIRREERPEVLILDPPKLARGDKEREQGLRTYGDLNRLGLEVVADGGLLLTCSCSGVVSQEDFIDVLRRAAARTGKELTVIRVAGAPPDHPVALHVPETSYLKAVFARVRSL